MFPQTSSSRWLAGMAIAVAALIVVSIVVVLIDRRGEAEMFPEGTPEGTVQRYLLAVDAREDREAYGYLSAELAERCDFDLFQESARDFQGDGGRGDRDLRVSLIGAEAADETMEVSVRVTRYRADPPFGGDERSSRRRFVLEETNGDWRFTQPPWPLGWCPEPEKPEAGLRTTSVQYSG